MANLKTWDCKSVRVYPTNALGQVDVVYNVNWTVNCVSDVAKPDGEFYKSRIYGSQVIPAPEGAFIPFKDLTESIVEGWTKTALGDETVAELYINLDEQIEAEINPTSLSMQIPGPVAK